jgi:hypothetical protein
MEVLERYKAWLVLAQLIDMTDYDIRQRYYIPTASYNFLAMNLKPPWTCRLGPREIAPLVRAT